MKKRRLSTEITEKQVVVHGKNLPSCSSHSVCFLDSQRRVVFNHYTCGLHKDSTLKRSFVKYISRNKWRRKYYSRNSSNIFLNDKRLVRKKNRVKVKKGFDDKEFYAIYE